MGLIGHCARQPRLTRLVAVPCANGPPGRAGHRSIRETECVTRKQAIDADGIKAFLSDDAKGRPARSPRKRAA